VQRVIQRLYPGKSFARDIEDAELDRSEIVPALRAEALLQEMGRPGWTSLDESVRMNTEDFAMPERQQSPPTLVMPDSDHWRSPGREGER
jgi:hypothetical protein